MALLPGTAHQLRVCCVEPPRASGAAHQCSRREPKASCMALTAGISAHGRTHLGPWLLVAQGEHAGITGFGYHRPLATKAVCQCTPHVPGDHPAAAEMRCSSAQPIAMAFLAYTIRPSLTAAAFTGTGWRPWGADALRMDTYTDTQICKAPSIRSVLAPARRAGRTEVVYVRVATHSAEGMYASGAVLKLFSIRSATGPARARRSASSCKRAKRTPHTQHLHTCRAAMVCMCVSVGVREGLALWLRSCERGSHLSRLVGQDVDLVLALVFTDTRLGLLNVHVVHKTVDCRHTRTTQGKDTEVRGGLLSCCALARSTPNALGRSYWHAKPHRKAAARARVQQTGL